MKMSKKAYLNKKENFKIHSVNASLAAYFDNLIEDGAITQNKAHRHSWYDGY